MKFLIGIVICLALLVDSIVATAKQPTKKSSTIWICLDENGISVFTNRPGQYLECKEYVPPPGLREALLEQLQLQLKEQRDRNKVPTTSGKVLGPL